MLGIYIANEFPVSNKSLQSPNHGIVNIWPVKVKVHPLLLLDANTVKTRLLDSRIGGLKSKGKSLHKILYTYVNIQKLPDLEMSNIAYIFTKVLKIF